MKLTRDEIRQAVFGISDGASTTIGAMFGLYASGHRSAVFIATLSAGIAATESMGAGEFLSDDQSSIHRAIAMSIGTAVGGLAPAIPFIFTTSLFGLLGAAVITGLLGVWVAEARAKVVRRRIAYVQVFGVFTVVAASTFLLGELVA